MSKPWVSFALDQVADVPRGVPMKSFSCGTIIPGCDARFVAESEADILAQVKVHAIHDHGIPEIDEATLITIESLIAAA
jgi:predicted small metal-binding protein